jgi:hypothetical protein
VQEEDAEREKLMMAGSRLVFGTMGKLLDAFGGGRARRYQPWVRA